MFSCCHVQLFATPWTIALQAPLSMGFPRQEYWSRLPFPPGEGNGTPLQYSCLENPMDGGPWWAAVHGVAKSRTRLSNFTFTFHFHALEKEMATHSSVLAWRLPGTAEPGGWPSMGSRRVGHDWSDLAAAAAAISSSKRSSCQGSNLHLLHCHVDSLPLEPPGKPIYHNISSKFFIDLVILILLDCFALICLDSIVIQKAVFLFNSQEDNFLKLLSLSNFKYPLKIPWSVMYIFPSNKLVFVFKDMSNF